MKNVTIGNDWDYLLEDEFQKSYFTSLQAFLETAYSQKAIFPPREDIFRALELTSYQQANVVLLGQDPYHGFGQAQGLSFSVSKSVAIPPSLRNMYKELKEDLQCNIPSHGDLTAWASQGVLLLNTVLTVEEGEANSHRQKGWEQFTDSIISLLNQKEEPIVFLLWGKDAQKKATMIDDRHCKVMSTHPSPLAAYRGFFGSRPFSKTNTFLIEQGRSPVRWCLDE
ncbi:uracil-DNA glycosylase [Geomicrobium sp. JCM 19038]|uniref:uracil-DNA glycosylase n=1 Tax=Geomicrobium sp. JCM 19038 TaxID=1460635 RepID=UPI00045F445A|nr:uracil-DNA glycosylase [Geomicrobium sp. JCM 19038]GAK06951.1 uracil-DNA glycosylase, family 1 [Geomicrobium sp. JCM 19038]